MELLGTQVITVKESVVIMLYLEGELLIQSATL